MTQPRALPAAGARRSETSSSQRILGLVLLLPALLAWIVYQVVPMLRTFWLSVRASDLRGDGTFVGLENYSGLPSGWFTDALARLLLGLLIAAAAVAIGILLGGLVRRAPIGWQRIALAAVGLGLVTYAPVNLVFALYLPFGPSSGLLSLVAMLPIPMMVGVLAATLASSGRLLLVIGAVTALGGAAWAMQGENGILTSPSPEGAGTFIYSTGFAMFDVGRAAAASTIMGVLLALLGFGAALMLLAIRPRFDLLGASRPASALPPGQGSTGGQSRGIVAVVVCGVVLLVLVVLALPWLTQLGSSVEGVDPAAASLATWSTAGRRALEIVVTVLVTGSAAVGLGYLRPFGRHSVRALLVFSPWLFVGLVPLMIGLYFRIGGLPEEFQAPFFGITVQMLAIPLLFLLTYLADGARTARDAGHRVPLRSVAGVAVLGIGIVTVVRSQEVVWDLVFLFQAETESVLMYVTRASSLMFGGNLPLGLLTPVPALVLGALVLAGAAALVPGIRLAPASALGGQQAGYGRPDPRQVQYGHLQGGHPEYGPPPVGSPGYGPPQQLQPGYPPQQLQPGYPPPQPDQRQQPQRPNPVTWGDPHG